MQELTKTIQQYMVNRLHAKLEPSLIDIHNIIWNTTGNPPKLMKRHQGVESDWQLHNGDHLIVDPNGNTTIGAF